MSDLLKKIAEYDLSTISVGEIEADIRTLGKTGIVLYKIPRGRKIFRARRHATAFLVTTEDQISYRKDTAAIKIGRANTPNQSIFYGALASEEINAGYVIAALETSQNHRTKINGIETFSIGMWDVISDFEVPSIVFDPKYHIKLKVSSDMHNSYLDFIDATFKNQSAEQKLFCEILGRHFSQIVGTEENELNKYKLTSAYSNLIYNSGQFGIAYPSIQMDYKGFNIALTPRVVDRHLKLSSILLAQLHRKDDKYTLCQYKICDDVSRPPFNYIDVEPIYSFGIPFHEDI